MWAIISRQHSAAVQRVRVRCECQCNTGLEVVEEELWKCVRGCDVWYYYGLATLDWERFSGFDARKDGEGTDQVGTRGTRTSEGTSRITHARKPFNRWTTNSHTHRQVDWYNANTFGVQALGTVIGHWPGEGAKRLFISRLLGLVLGFLAPLDH